jgi:TonB family protein
MNSAGQTLLDWVGPMNLATALVLLAALVTDRLLERRTCAAARLLPYLAVLVRLVLPAGWSSPLGLLGLRSAAEPLPWAQAELDLSGATFIPLDTSAPVGPGALALALWAAVSLTLLGCWIRARVVLRRQLRAAIPAGRSDSGIPVLSHPTLGPLVVGLWRSRIVVPAALAKNSDPEPLRWVLRHESAHVRRRDPLLSSVLQLVCLLAWPVLPVWIAARRIRTLMEIASDERAVAHQDGAARRRYGELLLELADRPSTGSSLAGVLSFASPLRGRLRALIPRRRWPPMVQALVVELIAVLAVACAGAPSGDDGAVKVDAAAAEAREAAPEPQSPPSRAARVPVVTLWGDGSAWVRTERGGERRLHFQGGGKAGHGSVAAGPALVTELRAALAETGARTLLVRADPRVPPEQMAPLLEAARRAGAEDLAVLPEVRQLRTLGRRSQPQPPILTVTRQGQMLLENRVVTLQNLEEQLRHELTWRKQDTLLIRADRYQLTAPEVLSLAKRAGAVNIGIQEDAPTPAPTPAAPARTPPAGALDPALVSKHVRAQMGDVRLCYEAALARTPRIAGRLEVAFTIGADGQVTEASLAASTLKNDSVEACVLELARTWQFPAPRGGPVEVTFPFVFSSSGG